MKIGHCKTCWWYKEGICYMQANKVLDTSYCPDYYNRSKGNKEEGKLNDWIKKQGEIKIFD